LLGEIPVVGAIPRLKDITFPGRHLGLVPPQEHPMSEEAISQAEEVISRYVDTEEAFRIAQKAVSLEVSGSEYSETPKTNVNIGVIRDSAFQFYYQENIDSLKRAGARVNEFSALTDELPQELDALYIGGGFPETHAEAISENRALCIQIREAAEKGLPIYAECGGLMYLAEDIAWKKGTYRMTGVLPLSIGVSKKPMGHGYTMLEVDTDNAFYKQGQRIRGHEFHYSYVKKYSGNKDCFFAFSVKRGHGIVDQKDGLCYKNVLATYSHVHALGTKEWERGIIAAAVAYKTGRKGKQRSPQRG
jgi:cobyrinic acid a,c-diamide synthase